MHMTLPHIICKNEERFISEIENGTLIGYKYFLVEGVFDFSIKYRTCMGSPNGKMYVLFGDYCVGYIDIEPSKEWKTVSITVNHKTGTYPLYLRYQGEGHIDLLEIAFN